MSRIRLGKTLNLEPASKRSFSSTDDLNLDGAQQAQPEAVLMDSSGWKELDDSPMESLRNLLREALLVENVVVLAGLGASRVCKRAPTMATLWRALESAPSKTSFNEVLVTVGLSEGPENFEDLLSRCQAHLDAGTEQAAVLRSFLASAEETVARECDGFFTPDDTDDHQALLRALTARPGRSRRAQLFTTNYDLMFETAARKTATTLIDGFDYSAAREFDGSYFDQDFVRRESGRTEPEYVQNVIQFLKLHGSLDWTRDQNGTVRKLPTLESSPALHPLLVFPRADKFRLAFQQPFFEMVSRWQFALRETPVTLLVIGFGFNDDHITGAIQRCLECNSGLRLIVVDFACQKHATSAEPPGNRGSRFFKRLANQLMNGDQRVTLVSGTLSTLTRHLPKLTARIDLRWTWRNSDAESSS